MPLKPDGGGAETSVEARHGSAPRDQRSDQQAHNRRIETVVRIVTHACGHQEHYRIPRRLLEHHLHELSGSPCTPCARTRTETQRDIYLPAR